MQLISLQKKLLKLSSVLSRTEYDNLILKHGITGDQLEQDINRQLYQKFLQGAMRNIPIRTGTQDANIIFELSGYILSEKDMLLVMKELLEADDVMKKILLKQIDDVIFDRSLTVNELSDNG
jgi:hypothetical protein